MIRDERHALYVGAVLALGMRHELDLRVIADELGNYTDRIELVVPAQSSGPGDFVPTIRVELVVPPPPAGWHLADWLPAGSIHLDRKDVG